MTVEDRLRQAMAEHTAEIPQPADRWDDVRRRAAAEQWTEARRRRRRAGGLTALAVAAVVTAALAIPALRHGPTHRVSVTGPTATTAGGAMAPTTTPATTPSAAPATTATTLTPTAPGAGYQPLWPFRSLAEADGWQRSYRSGGHEPWHLDPALTAVSFSSGYLGYTDITTAFKTTINATGAHVSVGFKNPNGQPVTAAIIHLTRLGAGPRAPWEVVGTDDTPDFSLTAPAYGSVVGSPVQVGGTVTGVDESIKVQALQVSSKLPVGVACCQPAGGTSTPWHTVLTWQPGTDAVVTIAASTGGHLATVERFAVTGVRTGR